MMHLLVACPSCKRQYDASGADPGDRFRCLCGESLTVPQTNSHEAAVVRCSSCGATRQGASASCGHGVWFDDDELAAILKWIRHGRSRLAREHAEEIRRERARQASPTTVVGTFPPFAEPPDDDDYLRSWTMLEFLLEVGTFLFRMLR